VDPTIFQSFRPEIQALLNALERDKIFFADAIGPVGNRPAIYDTLASAAFRFSEEEWGLLINHADPISFCYLVYQRILILDTQINDDQITPDMHAQLLRNIINRSFSREGTIKTMFGCNVSSNRVADAVFNQIFYLLPEPMQLYLRDEREKRKK
jgi:hypothetical protein